MDTLPNIKAGLAIALVATAVSVEAASAAGGGNATGAKLCQKGGWSKLMDASAQPFADENACVGYAAHDGAIYPRATLHLERCQNQPYDGLCVVPSGSGLAPGSVVDITISKNGSPVLDDWPVVQGDGTFSSTPLAHFEGPCVDGNVYEASATGTSASSVTAPVLPGIPMTSNTVERTSVCP